MNCTNIENKLVDYIDGALSEKEVKIIDTHIESCSSCKKCF